MRGAPCVVDRALGRAVFLILPRSRLFRLVLLTREIMQQPRLTGPTPLDDPLQVARLIPLDLLLRVAITRPSHQHGRVDDQADQLLPTGPEPGHLVLRRPHARRRVLVKAREFLAVGFQRRIFLVLFSPVGFGGVGAVGAVVERAVDVIAPLLVVDHALAQTLFAVRPADEVLRRRVGEPLECRWREGREPRGVGEHRGAQRGELAR